MARRTAREQMSHCSDCWEATSELIEGNLFKGRALCPRRVNCHLFGVALSETFFPLGNWRFCVALRDVSAEFDTFFLFKWDSLMARN